MNCLSTQGQRLSFIVDKNRGSKSVLILNAREKITTVITHIVNLHLLFRKKQENSNVHRNMNYDSDINRTNSW
jgi:hypothetical protein